MSESILKALMRLFAIIASDAEDNAGRQIVESYLKQLLNHELVLEYLKLYDEFVELHHSKKGKKRLSANSVKVLAICEQVNEELRQEQKILVLLQLLEFINYDGVITENEMEFVQTVAEVFNIPKDEFDSCKALVLSPVDEMPHKENLLLINNNKDYSHSQMKHLYNEHLNGYIVVLYIKSTNMYAFGYVGEDTIYLNGHVIDPKRIYIMVKGSSIRSPKIQPVYYSNVVGRYLQSSSTTSIVFAAENVEFRFKNSTNGIQNFNFYGKSGELIGVMGGSGAGKSTLLNVFNGNLEPQQGSIKINGLDVYKDKSKLQGVIGFVPQDDLLIEELTVWQNLFYNAKLCFSNFTKAQIDEAVTRVLKDLDLYEIRDLKVGSPLKKFISGGQRKRLNIALELIREPAVLFVDEPTSGLSSMDSEMVMDLLKEVTMKGKLAIINIHQPSSDIYKLFDQLIIMDRGGHPVFYGNPVDAVVYFKKMAAHINANESECLSCGNVNPEQVLQVLESKVVDEYGKLTRNRKMSSKEWYDLYKKNIESKIKPVETNDPLPENHFKIPNRLKQFRIFSIRDILSKLTNRQYMIINFLEAPALAFILGYFTKYIAGTPDDPNAYLFSENENLPGYLFMCVVVALFLGMTVSAEEIIRDRKILQRERFLNLSRFSYINSKVVLMFTISAIQSISFILIGNYILGVQDMTIPFFLVLFTTMAFANMLGLNISAALDSVVTIYILIPFILVPQLLLSGTIVKFDKLHKNLASENFVPIVGDMMTSRWAYEALVVYHFKNNNYNKNFYDIEKGKSQSSYKMNFLIPELETRATSSETYINQIKKGESLDKRSNVDRWLKILKNEIVDLDKQLDYLANSGFRGLNDEDNKKVINMVKEIKPYNQLNNLEFDLFTPKIAEYTRQYLMKVKKIYSTINKYFTRMGDEKYEELEAKLGKDELRALKNDNQNKSLEDLALNRTDVKKILETDDRLLQRSDPVYRDPESNIGRAHFYSPVKKLFGYEIDTYWFNIFFIWFTTLTMYITLLHDSFRKLIEWSGNIKFRKKND
ncbi:MAG: ATP-binding cassette domain-containing protein [Bacteroidales bacterium]|nr:ATP-binding cassette domain-containing protein [Bacteroidales bacterium]